MQKSIFIARLAGPTLLAIGIGMLLNAGVFRGLAQEFLRSNALIYITGVVTIVAALAIVNTHNVWVRDWRVIITLLGWLGLVGGVVRAAAPQIAAQIGTSIFDHVANLIVPGIVVLVLGGTLSYFGYLDLAPSTPARMTKRSKRK